MIEIDSTTTLVLSSHEKQAALIKKSAHVPASVDLVTTEVLTDALTSIHQVTVQHYIKIQQYMTQESVDLSITHHKLQEIKSVLAATGTTDTVAEADLLSVQNELIELGQSLNEMQTEIDQFTDESSQKRDALQLKFKDVLYQEIESQQFMDKPISVNSQNSQLIDELICQYSELLATETLQRMGLGDSVDAIYKQVNRSPLALALYVLLHNLASAQHQTPDVCHEEALKFLKQKAIKSLLADYNSDSEALDKYIEKQANAIIAKLEKLITALRSKNHDINKMISELELQINQLADIKTSKPKTSKKVNSTSKTRRRPKM